jgi:hypothetical protein
MKAEPIGAFRLTSRLEYPLPAYSGKVACIFDAIGRRPYLCAGDGPSDHAMLAVSEHRLWIARLKQARAQLAPLRIAGATRKTGWMIQAASSARAARFSDRAIPSRWLYSRPDSAESSSPGLNPSTPSLNRRYPNRGLLWYNSKNLNPRQGSANNAAWFAHA